MTKLQSLQFQMEQILAETLALDKFHQQAQESVDQKYREAADTVYKQKKAELLERSANVQAELRALISQIRKDVDNR